MGTVTSTQSNGDGIGVGVAVRAVCQAQVVSRHGYKIIGVNHNPIHLIKQVKPLHPNPIILQWVCVGFASLYVGFGSYRNIGIKLYRSTLIKHI
jgi:hypothetical protein